MKWKRTLLLHQNTVCLQKKCTNLPIIRLKEIASLLPAGWFFFSLYLIINWSAANQKISLNHDIMKKKFYSASEMHMDEFMICSSGTGSGTEEPHWIRWKISTDLYISVTAARIRYLRGSLKSSQQTTSYMVISTFLLYLLYCCF